MTQTTPNIPTPTGGEEKEFAFETSSGMELSSFRVKGHRLLQLKRFSLEWFFWKTLEYGWIYIIWTLPGVDKDAFCRYIFSFFPSVWLFYACVTVTIYTGGWLLGFGALGFLYHYDTWFESYRCSRNDWPWNRGQEAHSKYKELVQKAIDEFVGNQIVFISSMFITFYCTDKNTDLQGIETHFFQRIPPTFESCWKIFVGLLIFETIFYWTHRLEHVFLYQYHRVHHKFNYNELPLSVTGTYGHWIDGLFGSIIPALVPTFLLGFDLFTFWHFMFINVFHSTLDHCNFELPWNPLNMIPFSGWIDAHAYHHTVNQGAYSLYWPLWDIICGTDKSYNEFLEKDLELHRQYLREQKNIKSQ